MPKPVSCFLMFCLLAPAFTHSQTTRKDFSAVDSLARTIHYDNDIYKLTKDLTGSYKEQILQVRAIFAWITDNIRYDYKFVNKEKEIKGPVCKTGQDCQQVQEDWEKEYLKRILKKKKAICDGYARLFKKMCTIAGVPCEIIPGYTKSKPYQVGSPGRLNHAWNAIMVDSAWHLLDVTWASGGCGENEESGKLLPFHKYFDDYYWFTSFTDFCRNHYPKDAKWVLEPGYTKDKFSDNPWFAPEIIGSIHLASPATGVITAKKGDTLHFKFDYPKSIRHLQVNSSTFRNPSIWDYEKVTRRHPFPKLDTVALRMQHYITYKNEGDTYEFDYLVTDESLYYVEILFDYKKVMKFNIKINSSTQ